MTKIKPSIKIILGLFVIICFIIAGFFLFNNNKQPSIPDDLVFESDQPVPIVLSMDVNATKAFQLQIFWTEDATERFYEAQSVRQQINQGESHVEISIPADILHQVRLDFGTKPEKVSVKNIHITGLNPATLDVNQFKYFSPDVQTHEVIDGSLVITSNLPDPYTIYKPILDIVTD